MNEALLFPGQGAQYEGMGRDWAQVHPVARETFREASEALGFSLEEACWSSGETVHRTDVAQPGILVTSVAIVRVLESRGLDLASVPLVAGLSLGIANKFLEPVAGAVLARILVLVFIILFIQKWPRGLFPQRGRAAEG